MTKIARMIFVPIFAGITGAFIFLATWDIPAPSSTVEKVLPDDSFPN